MTPIIEVDKLSVNYGQTNVLSGISFVLERGDFIGVAGPNGAGKSTLIKALFGLVPKTSGSISLFGIPQNKFFDWNRIGYLPQKISNLNPLFPASVEEVVLSGLLSQKIFPKFVTRLDRAKVKQVLKDLEILDLHSRMLSELSGGQQQRVMLARTLVSNPDLLIFDEPSTALDPDSRNDFFDIVKGLNKKGTTVMIITHDTGYIGSFANKLLYIDRKLIHFGAIADFCCHGDEVGQRFERTDKHIIWHQHS
jgi:zinc transport system ATP-binding protein